MKSLQKCSPSQTKQSRSLVTTKTMDFSESDFSFEQSTFEYLATKLLQLENTLYQTHMENQELKEKQNDYNQQLSKAKNTLVSSIAQKHFEESSRENAMNSIENFNKVRRHRQQVSCFDVTADFDQPQKSQRSMMNSPVKLNNFQTCSKLYLQSNNVSPRNTNERRDIGSIRANSNRNKDMAQNVSKPRLFNKSIEDIWNGISEQKGNNRSSIREKNSYL